MIGYKVTEEVCVQSLVTFLEKQGIDIWFVNPTGGPWKTLRIPGIEFGNELAFEKEETRPDIIAFSKSQSICAIIEAKDNIGKLSKATKMTQYVKVFNDIERKISTILESTDSEYIDKKTLRFVPGYLYPLSKTDKNRADLIEELQGLHENEACRYEKDWVGQLHYIVNKNENNDIEIDSIYFGKDKELSKRICDSALV